MQAQGAILGTFVAESNSAEERFRVGFFPGSKDDPRPDAEERSKQGRDTIDSVDYRTLLTRRLRRASRTFDG